jgi:hypothetical protein
MYLKVLFFIAISMSFSVKADIYKRIGTDGRVYFTDRPEEGQNFNLVIRAPPICKKVSRNKLPIKQIEKKVKNRLFDPYSTHFKWPNNGCDFGEDIGSYCGFVNAKNRYGGYVGYAQFKVYLVKTSKGWSINDIKMGDDVWCKNTDE